MLRIDHVIFGVTDLDLAAEDLRTRHGLDSLPGGEHTGIGTANRIVPLGNSYLELMAVVRPEVIEDSVLAQRVVASAGGAMGWCLRTDDIDAVATRLRVPISPWSRVRPDGVELTFRLAGLERSLENPALPFFISWDIPAEHHPGHDAAHHAVTPTGIEWVQVAADAATLAEWLGGAPLPVQIVDGEPGVKRVGIRSDQGEITVEGAG